MRNEHLGNIFPKRVSKRPRFCTYLIEDWSPMRADRRAAEHRAAETFFVDVSRGPHDQTYDSCSKPRGEPQTEG
jgi:hypothetical protein